MTTDSRHWGARPKKRERVPALRSARQADAKAVARATLPSLERAPIPAWHPQARYCSKDFKSGLVRGTDDVASTFDDRGAATAAWWLANVRSVVRGGDALGLPVRHQLEADADPA